MSESNVETYKRAIEAFNRDGVDGAIRYFHPDAEVYDPDAPQGRPYRGREAVARFMGDFVDGSDVAAQELRMFAAGDRVVGLIHTRRSRSEDGAEVGLIEAHTLTFRDDKIVYWRVYLDPAEALADAGLDPAVLAAPDRDEPESEPAA